MMNRDEINDMVVNLKVERENYKLLLKKKNEGLEETLFKYV